MSAEEEFTPPGDCHVCAGETDWAWMGAWVRLCRSCDTATLGIPIRADGGKPRRGAQDIGDGTSEGDQG